ncbi:MAG: MFS transporter, partial [Eubacterium sp.]|nr:MFS transporter [Eubacterium sp.]
MNKTKTLSVSSALIYALGIFGVQIFIGYMNSFQTEFYNKMYSPFDSNIFYASAIIIFIAKLISCLFDPLIGAMIDKSSLKGGKMRPWVLRSALPLAVLTTLIFIYIPFDQFGGKILLYAYITVTPVL